jgi:DNA-binding CsgD family transcriptional regulator
MAVLVRDPERRLANRGDWLKTLYGLTPVEAGVAERIAQGQSVNHLAEELHVQPNTIRVHLKHIYRKTRTGRQSELVNLLTSDFLLQIPVTPRDPVVLSA